MKDTIDKITKSLAYRATITALVIISIAAIVVMCTMICKLLAEKNNNAINDTVPTYNEIFEDLTEKFKESDMQIFADAVNTNGLNISYTENDKSETLGMDFKTHCMYSTRCLTYTHYITGSYAKNADGWHISSAKIESEPKLSTGIYEWIDSKDPDHVIYLDVGDGAIGNVPRTYITATIYDNGELVKSASNVVINEIQMIQGTGLISINSNDVKLDISISRDTLFIYGSAVNYIADSTVPKYNFVNTRYTELMSKLNTEVTS